MSTLFLLPITLICLICLSYTAHTAETDEYDFDLLIFTQQWPATACKEWKKRDHSHTCSMPPKADSWTIHGIWPTKLGQMGPAFCNRTWLFDPEQVKPIEDQLERVWVNIFAGTSLYSLWSHEWTKHGTCAAILDKLNSEFKYFSMGLKWLGQYSMSNILHSKNIVPSNTQKYSIEDINNAIKEKLGVNPEIECKREDGESFISEIRICLTKDFEPIDCNGVLGPKVSVPTVLTNCDKHKDITYPHYTSNSNSTVSWITQLQRFIFWLQWFTF